jgi:molecular chaperone GrpE (heat shock protein)
MDEVNPETTIDAVISDSKAAPPVASLAELVGGMGDDAQHGPTVEHQQLASMGAELAAQSDLLKSSHNLLVDVAGKIGRMSDEAVGRATRPVFMDLILLYDSLQQARTWVSCSTHLSNETFEDRLSVLEAELLEILLRRDVQKLEETGTKLDRQRHRAVRTVATTNPEEDNQIREVIRAGFAAGERVLRPADVVIGKFDTTLKGEGE